MIILKDVHAKVVRSGDIAPILQGWLKSLDPIDQEKEHFIVVHLTTRCTVKFVEVVSIGSINASIAHPREVYRRAIVGGAVSILIAHNHPSGDCSPSNEDISLTRKVQECGEILSIPLVDHVIFAETGFCSLREQQFMR